MKRLLFIPIIAALLLIPLVHSVFADHVDGYDDLFWIKEIDNTLGDCNYTNNFSTTGYSVQTGNTYSTKYCAMFKVFNTVDVDGKIHQGLWGGTRQCCTANYIRGWIYDGTYSVTNSTQFPTDGFDTSLGAGLLYTNTGGGTSWIQPFTPDLSSSTQSTVTEFQIMEDLTGSGVDHIYVGYLSIEDLGSWSMPFSWTSLYPQGDGNWAVTESDTGGDLDYWSVKSWNPSKPDPPTGLTATALNDTSIRITWSDPVGQTEQQPDLDHIHLQVQNGTGTGTDYYWKAAGLVTDQSETFDWILGEAGHDYNFRAMSDGTDFLGTWSNEDSATTTGTEVEAQTHRPLQETYASDGIVDNAFYMIEYMTDAYQQNVIGTGNCDSWNALDSSGGWRYGFTGTGYGQCTGHIKSFPTTLIDGEYIQVGDVSTRSIDPVYYGFLVLDGDFEDVMDSDIWFPHLRQPFTGEPYPDIDEVTTVTNSAGILYSHEISGSYPDFTADMSSANLDRVTVMTYVEDFDPVNNDNASTGLYWLKIGPYEFYFPKKTGTGHEIENLIDESDHDRFRLFAFTPPKSVTSGAGVMNGVTADITYTVPTYDGGRDFQGVKIFRYCSDVDSDYTYQGMHRIADGTYTDDQFQQTWTGETYDVDPTVVYDFDEQDTWADDVNIDVITGSGWLDYNILSSATSDLARPNPGPGFSDTDEWTYDFDIYMDEIGEWAPNEMFVVAQDNLSYNWGAHDVDGMGISFQQIAGNHVLNAVYHDGGAGDSFTNRTPFDFLPSEEQDTLYFTVTRIDATNFSALVYSHESRLASNLIERVDVVLPGTLTDTLTTLMVQNNYALNSVEDDDEGVIYDMKIWSATTLADIGRTPTYSETANGSCEYKLSSINRWGDGLNSTAFTVSLGADNAPTFSEIEPQSAKIDWNISGEAGVTGYGIQYSFDDITFINLIADTGNTATNYNIDGIDYGTLVYVQWTDIIGGVQQSWSSSGSFTTLTVQAGGGGPISSKTEIPPEDLTPEFIPPDPKKGLTALDLLQANVERIAPGQTKKALLEIVWEGDSNLRINEVIVDESTGLKFAFQQPIEFPPSSTGKTTSKIPYTIEAPALLCTDQQTPKCVYNDATYEIPTNVFAESNNESIKFDSFLEIQVTDDFQFGMQEIFLGILGLVGAAVILGRHKGKNSRSKVMNRRPRPKTR